MAKKAVFIRKRRFFAYQTAFFVEIGRNESSIFFEFTLLMKNFSKLHK